MPRGYWEQKRIVLPNEHVTSILIYKGRTPFGVTTFVKLSQKCFPQLPNKKQFFTVMPRPNSVSCPLPPPLSLPLHMLDSKLLPVCLHITITPLKIPFSSSDQLAQIPAMSFCMSFQTNSVFHFQKDYAASSKLVTVIEGNCLRKSLLFQR